MPVKLNSTSWRTISDQLGWYRNGLQGGSEAFGTYPRLRLQVADSYWLHQAGKLVNKHQILNGQVRIKGALSVAAFSRAIESSQEYPVDIENQAYNVGDHLGFVVLGRPIFTPQCY
jgi:hypothetical protein